MTLDAIARRYGCRPSALLAIRDPRRALTIDFWAALHGAVDQEKRTRDATRGGRGGRGRMRRS